MATVRMSDIDKVLRAMGGTIADRHLLLLLVCQAMEVESKSFIEMCVSPQCKSLMSLFFLQERCKKLESQAAHFSAEDVCPRRGCGEVGEVVWGGGRV